MRALQQSSSDFLICADAAELAREAARRFAELADVFVASSGRFNVVLSGGSTPRAMYSILAHHPYPDSIPWHAIYFFWGDERTVPPEHPDSNYRMAVDTLLSKVRVPQENISRIPGEVADYHHAAASYSQIILQFFDPFATSPGDVPTADFPRFDLVFLGMGADGHTASLFPHTTALKVDDRIAVANYVDKLQTHRITLTATTINSARNVIFLIAGEDKAPALEEVIEGPRNMSLYPAQLIEPRFGTLLWMVDEGAAKLLSNS